MSKPETIYLYRRKGQPAWASCDLERYEELCRAIHLFDTRTAYSASEYDDLAADNQRLREALQDAEQYLSRNQMNLICSGSILHRQIQAALTTANEVTE
jgi:hypothetical protein